MSKESGRIRRLHIGGQQEKEGWEIFDGNAAAYVDHVGDAIDLSRFRDGSFAEIYASHIVEHLDYKDEMSIGLREWLRVLQPGGKLYVSVPDLERLCHLYITPRLSAKLRFDIMRMIFGGHIDHYDYHMTGLDESSLRGFLEAVGFTAVRRVEQFNLFQDASSMLFLGVPISLNLIAERPLQA